jgi:O-antigen ligase
MRALKAAAIMASIAFLLVWQGAYFPAQFIGMLALLAAAFIISGGKIKASLSAALLFAVSLLQFISLAALSENVYTGLVECLRYLTMPCALLFFLNSDARRNERAIFAGLLIIAALGLLAYWSVIIIPSGMIDSSRRLQSTIQYANTTALLMLIGSLYAIRAFLEKRQLRYVVCGVIFIAVLVLSGSRTTFVIAVGIWLVYAFIMAGRRGKLMTALAAAATAAAIAGLTMIPSIRLFRISLLEPTLVERWITYADALSMLKDKPFLGIGIGNWQTEQFIYQSAPYSVKYIHNYYLQLFLDGGLLAPVLFAAALVPALVRGIKSRSVHAVILLAVMLHTLLDFDLIFAAVGMAAMYSLSQISDAGIALAVGKRRFAAIAPLALILALWSSEMLSRDADTRLQRGALDAAMREYKLALAIDPLNGGLYYQMAQSTRDSALTEELIRKALAKNNPADIDSTAIMARICTVNGDYNEAVDLCEELLQKRRFSTEYQELYHDVLARAVSSGAISDVEYNEKLLDLDAKLKDINPLYVKYIEGA